ncbi:MAG: 23S rRNA (adenine(2503)-C(2))-methyltransferase RlmN [Vicinamibacterales bacterium]|jgi:23S rRNA (adenine2503-C2)-methyltransferase|nr:23S rRNA (adenine(2503)-C(2))-methyltransferase RlmN [Vicinamibacterales bacterium]
MPQVELTELTRAELEAALLAEGLERYRAGQIFQWVYRRGITGFAGMTDLPAAQRAALADRFRISTPPVARRDISEDGTEKFLITLQDGRHVESVFIPRTPHQTFCVSTQVGCAMGCAFCLTATMGLLRNLTPGEIVGQVRVLAGALDLRAARFNVVFMGMGEPLHNYDATMAAVRILADDHGFAVHPRRITVSTVGIVPGIERLAAEDVMPRLAVSLHAPTDEQRAALVPVNRKYPIADIIEACRRFPPARRGRITFEYVLLAGVNDAPDDARRLAALVQDLHVKVNLIPLNPAAGIPFERPSDERIDAFGRTLAERGVTVMVRKSRGRDIRAACGQLAVEGMKRSAAQRLADALKP